MAGYYAVSVVFFLGMCLLMESAVSEGMYTYRYT